MLTTMEFLGVVKNTPLVSMDLVARDPAGAVLMGLRVYEPARNTWFVPGGRIRKRETLEEAFSRIGFDEFGLYIPFKAAKFLGVFTHIYETNFFGVDGISTHYVVLAYEFKLFAPWIQLGKQYYATRWMSEAEARQATGGVHPNVLPYF